MRNKKYPLKFGYFLLRNVVQSITQCCAIFFESVLTEQFSTIKAQFLSIIMFISVLELKVNGYL